MGLGYLTMGASVDVVLCPGCPTLLDIMSHQKNTLVTQ